MIVFDYIYYLMLDVVFELRRRLPLYANDHARINSAYAFALLKTFQSNRLSLTSKRRLFEKYSKHFSMTISVKRMANTIYCDSSRTEFLTFLSANKLNTSAERMLSRVLHTLSRMPKNALPYNPGVKERLTRPVMPSFTTCYAQLIYHSGRNRAERFSVTESAKPKTNKESAILCLPLGRLVKADLETLRCYDEIIVMPQMPCEKLVIEAGLKAVLGARTSVRFYDPKDYHAAPYSRGDALISKACDSMGINLMNSALQSPSVRRFIPEILDEDLALHVSDILYRPMQRFYAVLKSIHVQAPGLPVYFSGPANALPRTLAVIGKNPVYILGQGSGVPSDEEFQDEWALKPSSTEMTSGLNLIFKTLKKNLNAALPDVIKTHENNIYVATNTRSKSYELAHKAIKQKLTDIASVTTFDFAAPQGSGHQTEASLLPRLQANLVPNLYNALYSIGDRERIILAHFLQIGSRKTLDTLNLGDFPTSEMKEIVNLALEQNIGALIGNVVLYRLMMQKLKNIKKAQLLLLPGRHGNIRCLARAFETAGLPILDVQVLFVSEMSRYKPPMSQRSAVIDSFARDRYIKNWGKSEGNIELIGAINLDEDIKKARSFDKKTTRKALLGSPTGMTVTFACQPLPEMEIMTAIEAVAKALKPQTSLHLCIKLHPSQSEALLGHISEYLMGEFGDKSRYSVLRNISFAKVMSVTDILVSYFSNVCLMAPAFNVPVITLPSSAPMPALTLADMGLAIAAKTLDDFETKLNIVLSSAKSENKNLPPYPYLEKNPHMTKPDSLNRLAEIVRRGFN